MTVEHLLIDDLVAEARAAGDETATRRTINYWRSQRLVAAPHGKRYPRVAASQVRSIVRWRRASVPVDHVRFAVYVETGAIPHEAVRDTAIRYFEAFQRALDEQAETVAAEPQAFGQAAETLAKARGAKSLPRNVRMALNDRITATMFALAQMLPAVLDAQEEAEGQFQLERMLGLRSGRGGATRDLTETFGDVTDAQMPELDRAITALRSVSEARLEAARRVVEASFVWAPAFLPLALGALNQQEVGFINTFADWVVNATPELYVAIFGTVVARALEKSSDEQINDGLEVFRPAAIAAEYLRERPEAERSLVLRRLPACQREQLASALQASG